MPTKFVWKKDIREWHPRKKGFAIGRIFYVPPVSGEIYYLRCLFNVGRGPISFKDIRTYNGVEYTTFRDACYAHDLLDDDKEYIDAIVEASYWSTAHSMRKFCKVLRLTKNLRLNTVIDTVEQQGSEQFADWITSIGDWKIGGPNDGYAEVEIPNHMLLSSDGDHIETIVRSTFHMFANGNSDASYLQGRAILAHTLDVVNSVNENMSELHTAESRTYFSCDTVCKADADAGILGDVHTPKFLNGIRASGVPNHSLTLKIGSPVMLLRNVNHSVGLCNGTRLVITKLADCVIEAELMDGANKGTKVLIPKCQCHHLIPGCHSSFNEDNSH
ncbi:PREDICTED: uncharacterized protein LOC109179968 [Ipomoea nil]|uniref:uncharacterized protein LOC109179968 n=1 Tax=Ipomoea nil TaxID=35883 RepID=UPI0009011974|nr:PREDICTED: uncharacterized protein LOC109179968 [Ipomoea nil]